LLQRYDGSIPFDKVQTLTVEDTPLKRAFGYATLLIETAGYAPGQSSGGGRGSEAAVPLAERDRVFELANAIDEFGTPALERPPKRVRRRYVVRYLLVVGTLTGVLFGVDAVLAPTVGVGSLPFPWYVPLALVLVIPPAAHLKWAHRGYWLGDEHVVTRNGVLKRQTKVVPYDRVQTVIDTRTLFQRRWNLATVTVDTAGSLSITGGDAAAVDVDDAVADDLRAELDERLREALAERRRARRRRRNRSAPASADATQEATERELDRGREHDDAHAPDGEAEGFVWGEAFDEERAEAGEDESPTAPTTEERAGDGNGRQGEMDSDGNENEDGRESAASTESSESANRDHTS
jgi:putative membrane protein